jgi:DNA end-binding protein Ku
MARAMWKGSVSFGLVTIPVRLFTAVKEHTVRFHRLSEDGKCRLRTRLYCPDTGKEYDFGKTARGYEVAPDQYVILDDDELEQLKPEVGRSIEIEDFVSLDEIDPAYFDKPYWLVPGEGGEKPYRLLAQALEESGRVGIARFALREKQHLCAVRVIEGGLALVTLRWHDEVTPLTEVTKVPHGKSDPRQLALANQLVDSLVRKFDPKNYEDHFRDEVKALIARKAAGERVEVASEPEADGGEVIDLMEALERSLKGGKGAAKAEPAPEKPKAKKPAKKAAAKKSA